MKKIGILAFLIVLLLGCDITGSEDSWHSLRDAIYDFRVEHTTYEGIPLDWFVTEQIGQMYYDVDYYGSYKYCYVRFDYTNSSVDFIQSFYCYDDDPDGWYY